MQSVRSIGDRFEAADRQRRADRLAGKPARWPWMRLPGESESGTRRAQMIGLTIGAIITVLVLALIAAWLWSALTYLQPAR
ncbi:MAG: hypothetical protein GY788_27630 [bacterium]|nr:hypothetical protein [bacterium]